MCGEETAPLGMANSESLVCLNHLMGRGELTRTLDAEGVAWYRLSGSAA